MLAEGANKNIGVGVVLSGRKPKEDLVFVPLGGKTSKNMVFPSKRILDSYLARVTMALHSVFTVTHWAIWAPSSKEGAAADGL